jgi:hypothetical protein
LLRCFRRCCCFHHLVLVVFVVTKLYTLKQLRMVQRASEPVIEAVGSLLEEISRDGDTEQVKRPVLLRAMTTMEQHSTGTRTNNHHHYNTSTTVPGIHLQYRKHAIFLTRMAPPSTAAAPMVLWRMPNSVIKSTQQTLVQSRTSSITSSHCR